MLTLFFAGPQLAFFYCSICCPAALLLGVRKSYAFPKASQFLSRLCRRLRRQSRLNHLVSQRKSIAFPHIERRSRRSLLRTDKLPHIERRSRTTLPVLDTPPDFYSQLYQPHVRQRSSCLLSGPSSGRSLR